MTERFKVCVNVYLFLQHQNRFLYYLRQNTGYEDGCYSLVGGHIDGNETATQAIIREAKEEVGISILEKDLRVVHMMHRKTNRENIDLFFLCKNWLGEIENKEPDKCADLKFFIHPPSNTVEYIKSVIRQIQSGVYYSEFGFS